MNDFSTSVAQQLAAARCGQLKTKVHILQRPDEFFTVCENLRCKHSHTTSARRSQCHVQAVFSNSQIGGYCQGETDAD